MLKVHDGKKALFYVIPLVAAFSVSMTVRPKERDALLADDGVASVHDRLRAAKKLAEGHALRFRVGDRSSCAELVNLVERVIALRTRAPR
jgi:hypothetical protein